MKKLLLSLSVLLLLPAVPTDGIRAQQSEEAQRLQRFAGEWTYDHMEGGAECQMLGDFIVHCLSEWKTEEGEDRKAVFLTRYDTQDEVYRGYRFYDGGYADAALGWVEGDEWTFVYEGREGARFRFSAVLSGDTWTYEWHRSVRGGPWEETGSGSMTKVR